MAVGGRQWPETYVCQSGRGKVLPGSRFLTNKTWVLVRFAGHCACIHGIESGLQIPINHAWQGRAKPDPASKFAPACAWPSIAFLCLVQQSWFAWLLSIHNTKPMVMKVGRNTVMIHVKQWKKSGIEHVAACTGRLRGRNWGEF